MKGIQRIRTLMKTKFVSQMIELGFQFDLKKDILYRQYNDMWQVILVYLTPRARVLGVEGFIILQDDEIKKYLKGDINNINYSSNAVASQPYMEIDSIIDDKLLEKSDNEIMLIIEQLYLRIEKKLLPYLNKKTREEIENDELKPDLSDYIRSIDIFTYFRQKYGYTPVSIKTKEELSNYKFVTMYLMYFHSVELSEDIEKIYDISQDEINKVVNDKKLYQENESIINDFIQEKMNED